MGLQSEQLAVVGDSYSLITARAHLGELVAQARYGHRPVAITEPASLRLPSST
jgi:hypothetical protein